MTVVLKGQFTQITILSANADRKLVVRDCQRTNEQRMYFTQTYKMLRNKKQADLVENWARLLPTSQYLFPICSQWDAITEMDEQNRPIHTFQVCHVMEPNQNNWLRSGWIQRQAAQRVRTTSRHFLRLMS